MRSYSKLGGQSGRDRMVVGFTTTNAIYVSFEIESRSWQGVIPVNL